MSKSKLNRLTLSERVVRFFATVFLNYWAIVLLIPLFFGINGALKENGNAFMRNPVSIVSFAEANWKNFISAFDTITYNNVSFFKMFLNSLFFATVPIIISLFFTVAVGYVVCKYKKYRIMSFLYSVIIIIQFIPVYGGMPATYKLFSDLGFINSYSIVFASFGLSLGQFLYVYAFFKNVPWTYAESAFIDGAGHWKVFLRIMAPQILPSVWVLFILSFIASWNDFSTCMLYYSEALPTLSFGIFTFYNKSVYMASQPIYMAACLLVSIPSIILYIIFQKKILSSLTISGVKG